MTEAKADPFAALEDAAKKQDVAERSERAVSAAVISLLLDRSGVTTFFAHLAYKLDKVPVWGLGTLGTDGRKLCYDPEFVVGLSPDELKGVVVHEVLHNALAHPSRLGNRDHKRFNLSCDLAINPIILQAGFQLPACRKVPGEGEYKKLPAGLSAEEYYTLLPDDPPGGGGGDEPDQGDPPGGEGCDPGGCGGVERPGDGSQADAQQNKAEWEVAVAQAHQAAKQRGTLPAGIDRLVQEVLAPKVDWREVLREFVSRFAKNDYSWSPPNRRFIHQGLYLPGLRSEELGDVVCAVDTSGSVGKKELELFASELQGILDGFDCALTILYHDSTIKHVQHWRTSDGPLVLEAKGGGGTSHCPVFDWIAEQGEPPTCLVCLTDLMSDFPEAGPAYPVLWATVGNPGARGPFGQTVEVAK